MIDLDPIAADINQRTGEPFVPADVTHVGGGCINTCIRISDGIRSFFVKLNDRSRLEMFEAEAEGLKEIAAAGAIKVPEPIASGIHREGAYLVMEFIDLGSGGDMASAGEQLAYLHRTTQRSFGWKRDNTIGATHQPNSPNDSWPDFWRDRRLGYQLHLAATNGHRGKLQQRGEKLLVYTEQLLDHNPQASLIHGDLWGGNLGFSRDGVAVIFDPAVYYGDREADLAMTELFGGFGQAFYHAYHQQWPLAPGYPTRRVFYNLYHILNHLNLFGGGYGGQALSMIDQLLGEIGH